jgi:hypothetical protein
MNAARADYEASARRLIGHHITAVRYWDIHDFSAVEREWDYGDWHHAVMGVELNTESGPCCVLWTNTFFPYGAEVFLEPITDHLLLGEEGPESWPADHNAHWQARLGSPIRDVTVWWTELNLGPATRPNGEVVEPAREVGVPVALRFDFEVGPVWFVAGIPKWPDTREVFIPGDEIMIVFTGKRMVEMGFPAGRFTEA